MKKLIFLLILVSILFAEKWEYRGILKRRIIKWQEPITDWTWERRVYYSADNGKHWIEFKDCLWTINGVKINNWFMMGHEFMIVLCKPACGGLYDTEDR